MDNTQEQNQLDHDKINTLVVTVGFIKEGQDIFHQEMKDNFKDLKENYTTRIDKIEIRLGIVETNLTKLMTWGSALIIFVGVLEFIISKFILKL